jgi:U3 small nucleolar RNA-associated protein 11
MLCTLLAHPLNNVSLSAHLSPTAVCLVRRKASAYRELSQRLERQQKLSGLASKMAWDKEVMGKGRKRKLAYADGSGSQPVYRWKRERKK